MCRNLNAQRNDWLLYCLPITVRSEEVLFGGLTNVTDMDVDDVNVYWIDGPNVSFLPDLPVSLHDSRQKIFSANSFYRVYAQCQSTGFQLLTCIIALSNIFYLRM